MYIKTPQYKVRLSPLSACSANHNVPCVRSQPQDHVPANDVFPNWLWFIGNFLRPTPR